jgi:alpha-N-arabinofuranosidase
MIKKKALLLPVFLLAAVISAAQNNITIAFSAARDTINKNIYGHFAEHLGRCIYDGIYVGEGNRKIKNKDGIRLDIVEALKKLKVPVLRWPGGCFADNYHWKDAIGPKKERRPIENVSWGNVREDNAFGTHEFLELCEMLNAEPYLAVNMGSGTVQEASEWVQYVNHANGSSLLTDMRKKNGRPAPWNVKYWGVGNESWDCGGHMSVDYYINEYKRYATFMTSYGNTEGLFRIAVGPGTEDYKWTESLMKNIPLKMMDGVSVHHYSVINWSDKGSATNFSEAEYFRTMEQAWKMEAFVTKNSAIMDKYDPQKKLALIVDEWGGWYEPEPGTNKDFLYQQNTMRDAMIAGLTLNIFNNHADRVRMANVAQIVNVLQAVILTKDEKLLLTPTYHVMEMYNVHQDALLLPLTVTSNDYQLADGKIKAVNASASKDKNGNVHISVVNIDARKDQQIKIDLAGLDARTVKGRILTSGRLQDYNSFEQPEKIKPLDFKSASLKNNSLSFTIPAFSVVVLEINK